DAQPRDVAGRVEEEARELLERLLPPPHARQRHDLAVPDRQDRLHVEQRAGQRLRASDPAALLQVLERADREDDAVLAAETLHQRGDLLRSGAALEAALDRERELRAGERRGAAVDEHDPAAAELGGGERGGLEGAGQLRRQVDRVDALVSRRDELLVDGEEVLRRGLRRRRQRRRGREPLVEGGRVDLDVVAQRLVAEAHVQRHLAHVREPRAGVREVGRRVEHDRGRFARQRHRRASSAACRIVATRSSSGPPLRTSALAPAARTSSSSSGVASAVRQTTAAWGRAASTALVASAPSLPGRRKSISTTSAAASTAAAAAARPSATPPTTSRSSSMPSRSSSDERYTSLSSTSRMRMGAATVHGTLLGEEEERIVRLPARDD